LFFVEVKTFKKLQIFIFIFQINAFVLNFLFIHI